MAKKRVARNRMMSEPGGIRRLWDETGHEWQELHVDVSREEVLRLLRDVRVRVGIHRSASELVWVPESEKQRVWREEIEPNYELDPEVAWKTRGQLPYVATLWKLGEDTLLLFDDFD